MATVRRVRRSPVRSAPKAPTVTQYQRSRASVVLSVFAVLFAAAWVFNGSFTADAVTALGGDLMWGWAAHLAMSAIEVAPLVLAPFLRGVPGKWRVAIWCLSVPFGFCDVFSSTIGLQAWMRWTGTTGIAQSLQNVALGEVLAFAPEPLFILTLRLIQRVRRA